MKLFAPVPLLFFALLPAAGASGEPAPPPLRFEKIPLGNVALILSARFNAPVTITANARAPITGDFSGLDLGAALTEAGRQAGLIARPLGAGASAGFVLEPPGAEDPSPAEVARALASAARRRAELLRQRAALIQEADP